jgi:hypothetical protein
VVVGENVEEQLQPYHEFECTGENDSYIEEIDETEEAREAYSKQTEYRIKSPTGELLDPDDDQFWRAPTEAESMRLNERGCATHKEMGFVFRYSGNSKTQVRELPFGYEEVKVPLSEVQTFREYLAEYYGRKEVTVGEEPDLEENHKYGFTVINGDEVVKTIRRTNPNAHWDWWVVGGRWKGFFKAKVEGAGELGQSSWTNGYRKYVGLFDVGRKEEIDFNGMRDDAAKEALEFYQKIKDVVGETPFETWVEILDRFGKENIDQARDFYHNQEAVKKLTEAKLRSFSLDDILEEVRKSPEQIEKEARTNAGVPFAIVKDGKWYAKGEMGWFGMSTDDMTDQQWAEQSQKMIDELPEDTLLTLVDCHI